MVHLQENLEVRFITGSQHLYGQEALAEVERNARTISAHLNAAGNLPVNVVCSPVLTTPEAIRAELQSANSDPHCIGIIAWMHTFSPAKMWIGGLGLLQLPMLHLHTQFSAEIPWSQIDMDYMNLHQSAHGDREFGFINARLRRSVEVVAGHWQSARTLARVAKWLGVARAWHDARGARFVRLGDNMRSVAVTEGDKVEAERVLGYSVNGYGVGDLAVHVNAVEEADMRALCQAYEDLYHVDAELRRGGPRHETLREGARLELGLRSFLRETDAKGFTTTFEDLHGLRQLPGLAVQRLMAEGYGFGAEGDWKHCALVRALKVMACGQPGGVSFMEDYTYHMGEEQQLVLGSHMLEICPSIAEGDIRLEAHPLGIGGKEDPVRLIFEARSGPAINASIIDMGNRFRLIVNEVETVTPPRALPKLPVARALWEPRPDFTTALEGWILAGGAHHTAYSTAVDCEQMEIFARLAGIEIVVIDEDTTLRQLRRDLACGEVVFQHGACRN